MRARPCWPRSGDTAASIRPVPSSERVRRAFPPGLRTCPRRPDRPAQRDLRIPRRRLRLAWPTRFGPGRPVPDGIDWDLVSRARTLVPSTATSAPIVRHRGAQLGPAPLRHRAMGRRCGRHRPGGALDGGWAVLLPIRQWGEGLWQALSGREGGHGWRGHLGRHGWADHG